MIKRIMCLLWGHSYKLLNRVISITGDNNTIFYPCSEFICKRCNKYITKEVKE